MRPVPYGEWGRGSVRGVGLITVQIINCTKSYIVTTPFRADREKLVINDQHPVILLTVLLINLSSDTSQQQPWHMSWIHLPGCCYHQDTSNDDGAVIVLKHSIILTWTNGKIFAYFMKDVSWLKLFRHKSLLIVDTQHAGVSEGGMGWGSASSSGYEKMIQLFNIQGHNQTQPHL